MEMLIPTIILIIGLVWAWKHLPFNRQIWRIGKWLYRQLLVKPLRAVFDSTKFVGERLFRPSDYRLHQVFLDNYPLSTLEFYQAVEEVFTNRQVVGAEISRVTKYEWNLLSSRRIYLQIRYREAKCVIGGLALGTGFQLTWRYGVIPNTFWTILFDVPFMGQIAERLFSPPTFYRNDIYLAFEQLVRATITETTNHLTQIGMRPLTENEQRPLLREFYE
jgi:hypothetical protein